MLENYLTTAAELGALYSLLALSACISFRFLKFPDLTVDGSFVLGAALSARSVEVGVDPLLAIVFAGLAGGASGVLTATLHKVFGVNKFFSGILMMMFLYTINLRVLGGANLSVFRLPTIFSRLGLSKLTVATSLVILLALAVLVFFYSRFGLRIRGVGINPSAQGLSRREQLVRVAVGLGLANALAGIGGALVCQYQSFVDVNMGIGVTVGAFAALFLGEPGVLLLGWLSQKVGTTRRGAEQFGGALAVGGQICAALGGVFLLQLIVTGILYLGLPPSDMRAVTALMFLFAMAIRRRHESSWLVPAGSFER